MLAGQSCRHQVGVAHGGSQVEVVGLGSSLVVREHSALRYVHLWGGRYPSAFLWWRVWLISMRFSKVQVNLEGPVLFQ